jgi:hypothetical protein
VENGKFILKRKDDELFRFEAGDFRLNELVCSGRDVFKKLPFIFRSGGSLRYFLSTRMQRFSGDYAMFLGYKFDGVENVLERTKSVSVLDDFWVDQVGSGIRFEDVDLWRGEWDAVVQKACLLKTSLKQMGNVPVMTPEWTSPFSRFGTCWQLGERGLSYLVSGNMELAYVSQIADFVGCKFPKVGVEDRMSRVCRVSPCFDLGEGDFSFISLPCFVFDSDFYDFVSVLGSLSAKKFRDAWEIVVFDSLVSGKVRDDSYVGFLQSNETFELEDCVSCYAGDQRLLRKEMTGIGLSYLAGFSKALGFNWIEKLKDLRLKEIPGCGVSDEILSGAESLIRARAGEFLDMQVRGDFMLPTEVVGGNLFD